MASVCYLEGPTGSVNVGTGPAGTTCQAGPTTHCIDLNGNSPGRIEQVIGSSISGQQCTVTFFMSRHVLLASTSATLQTFINGAPTSPATFVHSVPGVTTTNGQWEQNSFTFNAGSSTTLAFQTAMPGAAGPQIDNMTMVCVGGPIGQEPTAIPTLSRGSLWALALLMAALGIPLSRLARRKR